MFAFGVNMQIWVALALTPCLFEFVKCVTLKKGISHRHQDYMCGDWDVMDNIGWWYDWNSILQESLYDKKCTTPIKNYQAAQTYVPMIYNVKFGIPVIEGNPKMILAYNEPNHGNQGNVTVNEALAAQQELETKTSGTGAKLVGPSAATCGEDDDCLTNTAEDWLSPFYEQCQSCFDYDGLHFYGCMPDQVMKTVDERVTRYKRPAVVTEMVCSAITHPHVMMLFAMRVVPMLDSHPNVTAYAWYTARKLSNGSFVSNAASLLHETNTSMTSLGQFYLGYNGGPVSIPDALVSQYDYGEAGTPIQSLIGVYKEEALIILQNYQYNPNDWTPLLNAIQWNFGDIAASGQAFHIVSEKADRKTRIKNFFNSIMCSTEEAIVNDDDLSTEITRIKAMGITTYEVKKGRLKVPTC